VGACGSHFRVCGRKLRGVSQRYMSFILPLLSPPAKYVVSGHSISGDGLETARSRLPVVRQHSMHKRVVIELTVGQPLDIQLPLFVAAMPSDHHRHDSRRRRDQDSSYTESTLSRVRSTGHRSRFTGEASHIHIHHHHWYASPEPQHGRRSSSTCTPGSSSDAIPTTIIDAPPGYFELPADAHESGASKRMKYAAVSKPARFEFADDDHPPPVGPKPRHSRLNRFIDYLLTLD